MALLDEGPTTAAGRLLQADGLTRDGFLEALTPVRGNQRVTSAMPEVAYEALEKYGRDLVADAPAGGSTRSSAATPRSAGSSRSCPARPRTTRC